MKRWPVVTGFVLFVALCASAAYWAMQLFKPAAREVAAAPMPAPKREAKLDAAAEIFGGRKSATIAEDYALKGVMVARNPRNSVAILATEGKPARALKIGSEVAHGVTVKEVHPQYVLLSENGAEKRVPLPERPALEVKSAK